MAWGLRLRHSMADVNSGVGGLMNGTAIIKRAATAKRDSAGFTLIEAAVVIAIIGIVMAAAMPNVSRYFETGRGRAAAKSVADAFTVARAQAIRTGNNHIVFFRLNQAAGGFAGDVAGNPLTDAVGVAGAVPVEVLILNDGAPGSANQNCQIDPGEPIIYYGRNAQRGQEWGSPNDGINWGAAIAPAATEAPDDDAVNAIPALGSSFRAPNGAAPPFVSWVLFRPDGIPVAMDNFCATGRLGSGGGTIYMNTTNRDYAITLSPLGGVRVHVWDVAAAGWTQ